MVNAHTASRLAVATKATEAREALLSIRTAVSLVLSDKRDLDEIDERLCAIINRAMKAE